MAKGESAKVLKKSIRRIISCLREDKQPSPLIHESPDCGGTLNQGSIFGIR
jgi:hypothetical protein